MSLVPMIHLLFFELYDSYASLDSCDVIPMTHTRCMCVFIQLLVLQISTVCDQVRTSEGK